MTALAKQLLEANGVPTDGRRLFLQTTDAKGNEIRKFECWPGVILTEEHAQAIEEAERSNFSSIGPGDFVT